MTYDDDANSIQDSQLRDCIKIELPARKWLISTSGSNVLIAGELYTPYTAEVGDIEVGTSAGDANLEITIPSTHPAVQRYLANLCPPKIVTVTVFRYQKRSGEYRQQWKGFWTSLAYDSDNGNLAKILIPSRMTSSLAKRLPTITGGPTCPHILGDVNCRVDLEALKITPTVIAVAGAQLTISSIAGKPDHWAQLGKIVHPASGEWMAVVDQVGPIVTMQYPIFEVNTGDEIYLYPGCSHLVGVAILPVTGFGCLDGFNNVVNFGGQPILKLSNAFQPGSRGSQGIDLPPRHVN